MSFWANLQKREQLAVLWGGGIVLALLAYMLVIAPLGGKLVRMRKEVAARKADLVWMEDASAKAAQMRALQTKKSPLSPIKLIDQTARSYGVDGSLKRVDPGNGDKIQVWFEGAVYVDLMKFLRSVGASGGLGVTNLSVEGLDESGLVNARVTFRKGQ
jgi:type II secretory pathway component PulM